MRLARLIPVLALALIATFARAGDAEAQAALKQAYDHWRDPDPAEALRLAESALAANPTSQVVRVQIQLFIGSLHQVKTGNLDAALERYDQIITSLVGATDPQLRQLKADAMVRKGNILYAERDDPEGALRLFNAAHETYQLSSTVDTFSQLAYRLGRQGHRPQADRDKFMDFALKGAEEAITLAPRQFPNDATRLANSVAKYKLQLCIVQTAMGQAEAAQRTWASIEQDKLTDAALYQRAVLHALKSEDDQAMDVLRRFMATRPAGAEGLKARNQLRKFIRTEPDFERLRSRPDWAELSTDEPDGRGR
jgi:tetratricopeptide (TPR) repeat protein